MKRLKLIAIVLLTAGLNACYEDKDPDVIAVPVTPPAPSTVVVPADNPPPSTIVVPGPEGPPGPAGPPGEQGDKGETGDTGDTVIIETEKTVTDANNDGIDDKEQ